MTTSEVTEFPRSTRGITMGGVHLHDVLDEAELTAALAANHVRVQTHPSEPLAIINYTELCAYSEAWNPTTLACRGLIYRTDTGRVVARGFNKFFNHGQAGAAEIPLHAPVHVTDKADGSLGIIYALPSGGWAVATRGSFASEQAIHATRILNTRYAEYRTLPWVTTLVEIVYPENRIVLDYAGLDDLILLGGVVTATGEVYGPEVFASDLPTRVEGGKPWTGPVTARFTCPTFADALAMEPRENAEGIVVLDRATGAMVKLKQEDYVALHRIVTNLTARKIHEALMAGQSIADFTAPLPDEFHGWCREVAEGIETTVRVQRETMSASYHEVVAQIVQTNPEWTSDDRAGRKEFAMVAAQHPDRWALFALLDGRDIGPELLKRAQPGPYLTPSGRVYTEETA
jgi:RNA ligase